MDWTVRSSVHVLMEAAVILFLGNVPVHQGRMVQGESECFFCLARCPKPKLFQCSALRWACLSHFEGEC